MAGETYNSCHDFSIKCENFSTRSSNVVLDDEDEPKEWMAQVASRVLITFTSLPNGGNDLKRIQFCRETFKKCQAQQWWAENYDLIMELYDVQRLNRQVLHTPVRSEDVIGSAGGSPLDYLGGSHQFKGGSSGRGREPPSVCRCIANDELIKGAWSRPIQSGKVWGGKSKTMVGRESKESRSAVPMNYEVKLSSHNKLSTSLKPNYYTSTTIV